MSELAWSGLTVSSTIGGVLLILLVGYLTLRQRWIVWVSAAGVYGLCVLLINAIQPPFRYDLSQLEDLYYSELGVTALLILIALWLIVRAAFRQSIRARLLVSFVLMALFLAGALSAVSAFQGF